MPAFNKALEDKLNLLMTTPIGAMAAAVGASPTSLLPVVKPIIKSVGLEVAPRVARSLSSQAIPLDKFRDQVSDVKLVHTPSLAMITKKKHGERQHGGNPSMYHTATRCTWLV